jgi:hypothetical protein
MSQQSAGFGPPRWGRPGISKQRCGLSRSELYVIATENKGVFRKRGAATIVDYDKVDQILAKLPDAEISMSVPKKIKTK